MEWTDIFELAWSFAQAAWPWLLGAVALWFFGSCLQHVLNQLDDIQINVAILRRGLDHMLESEDDRLTRYERELDKYTREGMPEKLRKVLDNTKDVT